MGILKKIWKGEYKAEDVEGDIKKSKTADKLVGFGRKVYNARIKIKKQKHSKGRKQGYSKAGQEFMISPYLK